MKKRIIPLLLSLAMVITIYLPVFAKETEPSESLKKVQTIKNLNNLNGGKLLNKNGGQVFISGKLSTKQIPGEKSASKFLEENKSLFGIENITDELKAVEVKKDEIGDTFVKFEQLINGIKVNNSSINVHFNKNGVIVSVNGKLEKNKAITTLGSSDISENDAVGIAKKQFTYKSLKHIPKAEKLILSKDNKNYEVYKVNIFYMEPTIGNYDVFIEVHSGKVIQTESKIRYDGSITGSGIDVLGNIKPLNLYQFGTSYQMKDLTKPATNSIETYDMEYGTSNGYLISNTADYFNSEYYKTSVSAHYNAGQVIDFYKNLFGRNSLDDNLLSIKSFTHYSYGYNNAFWDGAEMIYGDGDGTTFTYLSGDLDVVGHEMTHGVISSSANMTYHNEPGALNESMADVFGVLIETYNKHNVAAGGNWTFNTADWVVGDEIYTPNIPGDALRSLSNPLLYGQPDSMNGYQYLPDTEVSDNGGVHTNSGIPNKAAYLIAQNIGMEKTARIYYRALTYYMNVNTDFEDAKKCLIQAASDLYGVNNIEVSAINNAFTSVGVVAQAEDPYEPNDSMETAYPISLGKTYQSYISSGTDLDIYKLDINSGGNINIVLSNLPADYDLYLYDSNGNLIDSSFNNGTDPESINFNASAGSSYNILVYSDFSEYSTTQKYYLTATKKVTGVSIDKATANLKIGETTSFIAAVNPADATNKNVTWSSSNASAATVDNAGKVTAAGEGTAAITVTTADGGYTARCSITVQSNEKPVISGATEKTIKIGDSFNAKTGVTASDKEDGNLTSKIVVLGSTNIANIGKYPITYTVTDSDGNKVSKSITITVAARNIHVVSLIGSNRYDTAVKLSQSQFVASDTILIVNGAALADGLGATPLAAYKKAPILLTEVKSLPAATVNEIKRLKPKNAIIVGGIGVVSDNVYKQLKSFGLTVTRLSGQDRYGTSLEVAKYIDKNCYDVSKIVISNGHGEADALSIASAAGRDNMPIILADKNNIPTVVYGWLSSENIGNAYIIGGTGVVSDNVLNKIDAITTGDIRNNRLGGQDRFETNSLVIKRFYGSVINKTYIAKSYLLIDALAAGPVAAINGAPVVLSGTDINISQKTVLGKKYGNTIIRTGGGISDTAVNSLIYCLQ